jgi:hypothetical protein
MRVYDHYYAPNPHILEETYDFVTCTETFEHFFTPHREGQGGRCVRHRSGRTPGSENRAVGIRVDFCGFRAKAQWADGRHSDLVLNAVTNKQPG